MEPFRIREATPEDVPSIGAMVRELAEYERLAHEVVFTDEDFKQNLFGPRKFAEVLIAEEGSQVCAYALFFHSFSTFHAKPGVYLEDLFVRPPFRGRGYGKALLAALADLAVERGCPRLEWSVLDWNSPALGFYEKLGAKRMSDWTVHRLTGNDLHDLAKHALRRGP